MKVKPTIEKIDWMKAQKEIKELNEDFVKVANGIEGINKLYLWRVSYPFGAKVIKDGLLYLPDNQGGLLCIKDERLSSEMRKDLDYNRNMPVGIIVDKLMESYFVQNDTYIPYNTMPSGRILSLWSSLQEDRPSCHAGGIWQVTAGARSLLMLPKISETLKYKRLKNCFCLKTAMPKKMLDQFELYREICNCEDFPERWECVIYFLPKLWMDKIKKRQDDWDCLRQYGVECVWHDSAPSRSEFLFDVTFSLGLKERNLKPNPYLFDTYRHVCEIARGASPGFKIADNDMAAPVSGIQTVFDQVYDLSFMPTMVHLANLNQVVPGEGLYYSLEVPIMLSFSPKARILGNKLEDLREIKHIADRMANYIKEDTLKLKDTPVYELAEKAEFEFYHSIDDRFGEIKNTKKLLEVEKAIVSQNFKKPFCHTSIFLRGCIRMLCH